MLTKRGADILVRVEKLLDEAGKTAGKTSASEPPKPVKPVVVERARLPGQLTSRPPATRPRRRSGRTSAVH